MMATSQKRSAPAMEEGYFVRSLSTPMRLSATGEICCRTFIGMGATVTIGRSRKFCDITFEDARVSRKHCQLRLLPHSNSLVLLNGATTSSHGIGSAHCLEEFERADTNRCTLLSQKRTGIMGSHPQQQPKSFSKYLAMSPKKQLAVRRKKKALKHCEEKLSTMEDRSQEATGLCGGYGKEGHEKYEATMPLRSVLCCNAVSGLWKPSLNGIFVNGHVFKEKMMILMPGDEVSLIGPTEGGKSLDSDCPKSIGFVVELQHAVKKPQYAAKRVSLQRCTKHFQGRHNFSAPDTCNEGLPSALQDVCILDHSERTALDNKQSAQLDTFSNNLLYHNHTKNAHLHMGTPFDAKLLGGSESNTLIGDTITAWTKSSALAEAVEVRTLSPAKIGKSESSRRYTIDQAAQLQQTSCLSDQDSKFLSTFNLVKASAQLRFDLLNSFTIEHSHSVVGLEEPLLVNAKENFEFKREGNIHLKSMAHSNSLLKCKMPDANTFEYACNVVRERQTGEYVFERPETFTCEDTIELDTSSCREVTLPENHSFGVDEKSVSMPGGSVLVCKEENSLKGPLTRHHSSEDGDSSMSQRTRILLASQTNTLSDTLEKACSQKFAKTGDFAQETVNRNFSRDVHTEVHAIAEKKVMNGDGEEVLKTGKCLEPAHGNDTFRLMFETQTRDMRAATESRNVFQGEEELCKGQSRSKKEAITFLRPADEGIMFESQTGELRAATDSRNIFQGEEELFKGQSCLKKEAINFLQPADEGCSIEGLNQGQVAKDGACTLEGKKSWDFQKYEKFPAHTLELEVADTLSYSHLAGAEASKLLIKTEECLDGDHNFSVTTKESNIEIGRVLQEMVHKGPRVSNIGDDSLVQGKNLLAVQDLKSQKITCDNMHWPQPLSADSCTSGLPAAAVCHLDTPVLKYRDFCKGEALQKISEPRFASSSSLRDHGNAKQTSNACLKQISDDLTEDNAATKLAIEQSKIFYRRESTCTENPINDSCFDQGCKDLKEGNAATEGAIEPSESFHRREATYIQSHMNDCGPEQVCENVREGNTATEVVLKHFRRSDRCSQSCIQSLTVSTQGDDEVKKMVQNGKTCSINAAGYYMNLLRDEITGAPINHNNAVCLWDLLALNNDVQALFLATFTYDLEWYGF